MSRPMDRQRMHHLAIAAGAAALALVLALALTWFQARQVWQPDVSGPVLPNWPEAVSRAAAIEIDSAGDHFRLQRTAAGWAMPSRDDHPVQTGRLAELDTYLARLTYAGARTSDPDKHARLGLAAGGEDAGTRVTVTGSDGTVLADIVLGREREGQIYVRFPGRDRTYAAEPGETAAALPEIADAADWLDLDFLELGQNAIARTVITPETGPSYVLERASPSIRNFALREPAGWRPITAAAGNGPASALARVRFRDVRAAQRLNGEVVAHHSAETFGGLRVSVDVMALADTRWAVISATALSDDAQADAETLNVAAEGWAFLLSDLTLDRLIRPLDQIADPRPEDRDDAP
ncbi:DUF4340 domain-containing protein [Maricaulis sp.]|uniref:DUF4340 domain-containing protein n=1 Tax=Maricaulis sp. TaxID=1486257 RepID=UPI0026329107|nr:DUF4340 domain-containing protein [Maricaulis sp.]